MQTDWLIDFMTLAQTRSFSRSAQLRHVTQPAFSRRIRSLEAWAATLLVDRSRQPPCLTQAGKLLHEQAPTLVASIQQIHALLRTQAPLDGSQPIEFAAPHALLHFFPEWLGEIGPLLAHAPIRLNAIDHQDACRRLLDGACDLLLTYGCAELRLDLDAERCEQVRLGSERLLPCAKPGATGRPAHAMPGRPAQPLPYLAYSERSGLGRVVEHALSRPARAPHLRRVFESDTVESLKAMCLAGHGVAFLPERSVQAELACERLVPAGAPLDVPLDICLLRPRASRPGADRLAIDTLWQRLRTRGGHDRPAARQARAPRAELLDTA